MATQLTSLTIFVSGPSDSEAEKAALRAVVGELSHALEKTHRITLRLIGWPESIRPGVDSDPQSVINRQVDGEYDIYIGILGARFGQPTPRAGSGTEEEFRHALERFRQNTSSVRVLFYFKRAPVDPFSLDSAQIENVQQFRQSLGAKGVLFQDFADTAAFTTQARSHIHDLIVDEWLNDRWKEIPIVEADTASDSNANLTSNNNQIELDSSHRGPEALANFEETTDSEDDLGLLELLEEFSRATEAAGQILQRIADHTAEHSKRLEQRTNDINKLVNGATHSNKFQQLELKQARAIAELSAADLDQFASNLNAELQTFRVENRTMFDSLGRAIEVQREFGSSDERLREDRISLIQLVSTLTMARDSTIGLQGSIARMPGLVGSLKRARKRLSGTLGELIAEIQFAIQEGNRIVGKMLGDSSA